MTIWELIAIAKSSGKVGSMFHLKGSVLTENDLPETGEDGDVYLVDSEDSYFAWDGEGWTDIGQILTADEAAELIDQLDDEVADLKSALDEYEGIFTADVDTSVQNWLDAHPEATTTVQDGSITEVKLASALDIKINKDALTPEMFGAVGDGTTDDTTALQAALDAAANGGTIVMGREKTYLVSLAGYTYVSGPYSPKQVPYMLMVGTNTTIIGNGATIKHAAYTQEEYTAKTGFASMLFLNNACKAQNNNAKDINDMNFFHAVDLTLDGGMSSSITRSVNAGGEAKGIHSARRAFIHLERCTIKEFPGEGIYGGINSEAYNCLFQNCSPSCWNTNGKVVKSHFISTERYCTSSEFETDGNIFDSCIFDIDTNDHANIAGLGHITIQNCVFNRSTGGSKPIVMSQNNANILIDSCVFNDAISETASPVLDVSAGVVSCCKFVWGSSGDLSKQWRLYHPGTTSINNEAYIDLTDYAYPQGYIASKQGQNTKWILTGNSAYKIRHYELESISVIPTEDCTFSGYGPMTAYGTAGTYITLNKTLKRGFQYSFIVDYDALGYPGNLQQYMFTGIVTLILKTQQVQVIGV